MVSSLNTSFRVSHARERLEIPGGEDYPRVVRDCGLYSSVRGTTIPTGAEDGTRADGVLDQRRRRQFPFSLIA
jgi:hypothetical protein